MTRIRPLSAAFVLVLVLVLAARAGDPPPPPPALPRQAATPNRALSLTLPEGWAARPLKTGLALDPPGSPIDETIVAACEPFPLDEPGAGALDEKRVDELFDRFRAGQLARFDDAPRPQREKLAPAARAITFRGADDGGRPAAIKIYVLSAQGRAAILTARLPASRLAQRAKDLDAVFASFEPAPIDEQRALERKLAGTWRSDAAPLVRIRFLANGTFEEERAAGKDKPPADRPSHARGGTFYVIGREVRMRFDEGEQRSFLVDEITADSFVSAGQTWKRTE